MKLFTTKKSLSEEIKQLKEQKLSIGFVPTMGALHEGHLSLVRCSKKQCDITVVSIFVNPTQFNDKTDLEKYPRMPEKDIELLEKEDVDFVFLPSVDEMYPEPDNRVFDFGNIDKVMEGKNRPGHFNGVAQVVSKLFDIVMPDKAFFGRKDFQQVAVINAMVKQLNYNIQIVPCEIVREPSGLAMSSRNLRLSDNARKEAAFIYKTLQESKKTAETHSVDELVQFVENKINKHPLLKLEYFEIVDNSSLEKINNWNESEAVTGCIVVHIEGVRLIDNIQYKP